jgi:hypothetical protein
MARTSRVSQLEAMTGSAWWKGVALLRHVTLGLPDGAPGLVLVERHPAFDADTRPGLWILPPAEQFVQ